MALDARTSAVFEHAGPDAVRLSAKTRYRVTRTVWVSGVDGSREMSADTIGFGTGAPPASWTAQCALPPARWSAAS